MRKAEKDTKGLISPRHQTRSVLVLNSSIKGDYFIFMIDIISWYHFVKTVILGSIVRNTGILLFRNTKSRSRKSNPEIPKSYENLEFEIHMGNKESNFCNSE